MRLQTVFLALAVCISLCPLMPVHALEYQPFDGREGYQEIPVSSDLYFVAFHGSSRRPVSDVEAAWKTRAAEVCVRAVGADHFIEVYYAFDPVLTDDPLMVGDSRQRRIIPARGGFVFIPIFVPLNTRPMLIDAPSRQTHVRCIRDANRVVNPERLVETRRIMEDAKARGWFKEDAK